MIIFTRCSFCKCKINYKKIINQIQKLNAMNPAHNFRIVIDILLLLFYCILIR